MIRACLVAVVATLVAAMGLAGAGIASAHAARIGTDPAENAALTRARSRSARRSTRSCSRSSPR